jgi:spermidine/putrescine transport system ATP-binding protein
MKLALDSLVKRYGEVLAVDGVSMDIPDGEFFTLLGPSGCGKTTTLRLIAGFETLDSGAIRLDGEDISQRPPHKRPVNTVFQSYALFPHMSVEENVAFGLRYKRGSKAELARRVHEAMELVQLGGLEARRPGQLSGGQQQRVALARAIVLEPPVLLLDEPLGALDARLRVDLQVELKRIQETLGITFVYVTHDQDEALTMSDRVAVMHGGKVEQCGEPRVLYEEPQTAFVANFLGASNLIEAQVSAGALQVGEFTLRANCNGRTGAALAMIRPERVRLEPSGTDGENRVPGMVEAVVYMGFHQDVRVRLASGALVRCDIPNDGSAVERSSGDPVSVHLPAECLRVLEAA